MIDVQQHTTQNGIKTAPTLSASIYSGGQISKGQLFYILRPTCARYNSKVVCRFFSEERMLRCKIEPNDFPKIRLFSADATSVIIEDLKRLQLI